MYADIVHRSCANTPAHNADSQPCPSVSFIFQFCHMAPVSTQRLWSCRLVGHTLRRHRRSHVMP